MDSVSTFKLHPLKANLMLDIFGPKESFANFWWIFEPSANAIHHWLGFNLSSESLVVDNYRWEKAWAKFRPVFYIIINHWIIGSVQFPVFLRCIETVFDTLLNLIPICINSIHAVHWALLIDNTITFAVNSMNIFPPHLFLFIIIRITISPFIKTHLSKVF